MQTPEPGRVSAKALKRLVKRRLVEMRMSGLKTTVAQARMSVIKRCRLAGQAYQCVECGRKCFYGIRHICPKAPRVPGWGQSWDHPPRSRVHAQSARLDERLDYGFGLMS